MSTCVSDKRRLDCVSLHEIVVYFQVTGTRDKGQVCESHIDRAPCSGEFLAGCGLLSVLQTNNAYKIFSATHVDMRCAADH
jgi:hypothetical protein